MIVESAVYIIAIYLRLSKADDKDDDKDKKDESLSISNQREILYDFVKEKFGATVEIHEFVDDGYSGMNNLRPELNRMLQMIQDKKINCVIVKDVSRLARKNSLVSYYVEELFYEENIRFISLLENFDNTKDEDTEKLIMTSFFNEYHVKSTSKKVRATKLSNAKHGLHTGGFAPYGYKKDSNDRHKLLIDEKAAEIVRLIFKEFLNGKGLKNICYMLTAAGVPIPSEYKGMNRGLKSAHYGIWTTKTIADMLHNPTYAGHLTQHKSKARNISSKKKVKLKPSEWIIAYNSCPAIINQETFDSVNRIWEKNKRRTKKTHEHLLTGFCYCKDCGHTMGITLTKWTTKDGITHEKYLANCNFYKNLSKYNCCTPHKIAYDELEKRVLKDVKDICKKNLKTKDLIGILKNNDKTANLKKEIEISIKTKENNIKIINEKKDRLYEDKLSEFISKEKYLSFEEKFNKEISSLTEEILELKKRLKILEERILTKDNKYIEAVKEFIEFNNIDRELLSELIDKIYIDESLNIEIDYNIKPLICKDEIIK